jgi:hypothetical protein
MQLQSELRDSYEMLHRMKSMNITQHTMHGRISVVEAGKREVSAQYSAIETELTEMHKSVNERKSDCQD